jgi:hypothetical protein
MRPQRFRKEASIMPLWLSIPLPGPFHWAVPMGGRRRRRVYTDTDRRRDLDRLFAQAVSFGPSEFQSYALRVVGQYRAASDAYADAAKRVVIVEVCRRFGVPGGHTGTRRDMRRVSKRLTKAAQRSRRTALQRSRAGATAPSWGDGPDRPAKYSNRR